MPPTSFGGLYAPVSPPDHFTRLGDWPKHRGLVGTIRGSAASQRGNLKQQKEGLERAAREHGVDLKVFFHYGNVCGGKDPDWLLPYALTAKQEGRGLLARSVNRYIRPLAFHHKDNPGAPLLMNDILRLQSATLGVPLVTVLQPSATWEEERAAESTEGKQAKGGQGGKPPVPEEVKEAIRRLAAEGHSYRAIAGRVRVAFPGQSISHMAVSRLLKGL
jgi:hypothetical protein